MGNPTKSTPPEPSCQALTPLKESHDSICDSVLFCRSGSPCCYVRDVCGSCQELMASEILHLNDEEKAEENFLPCS